MPLICLLMCDIQSVWSMILIPSVSEEQLLPPDGQCSWQQYRIGYDLYFTWTVYYYIYATLTYIYTLSEKVLLSDLISVPIYAYSLANGLTMKRDVYISMRSINVNCPRMCIYVYIAIDVYSVHVYIFIWVTCKFKMHEANEEQKHEELLWTIEQVINDELFASNENLLMKF